MFDAIKCIAYHWKYIAELPILKCGICNIGMQCLLLLDWVLWEETYLYGPAGTAAVQFHDLGYNVYEASLLYLSVSCQVLCLFKYYLSSYLADDAWLVTA